MGVTSHYTHTFLFQGNKDVGNVSVLEQQGNNHFLRPKLDASCWRKTIGIGTAKLGHQTTMSAACFLLSWTFLNILEHSWTQILSNCTDWSSQDFSLWFSSSDCYFEYLGNLVWDIFLRPRFFCSSSLKDLESGFCVWSFSENRNTVAKKLEFTLWTYRFPWAPGSGKSHHAFSHQGKCRCHVRPTSRSTFALSGHFITGGLLAVHRYRSMSVSFWVFDRLINFKFNPFYFFW